MMPSLTTSDDAIVSRKLAALRRQIRSFVLLEGLLYALLAAGGLFWIGLLLDWFFEPSVEVRRVINWGVGLLGGGLLLWWIVRRLLTSLPDRSLALLVERKHPGLADRVSTAVDLSPNNPQTDRLHPELVAHTKREAAASLENLDVAGLLNYWRLRQGASVVVLLSLSLFVLAVLAPTVWSTYTNRLALSPRPWPRSVDLSIEGFVADGQGGYVRKVARNSDVPVVVNARITDERVAPERVKINYRWRNGQYGSDEFVRVGQAVPPRDTHQRFEYVFERISDTVEFRVRGGDDQIRRLRIEVVERPKVTKLEFTCDYPAYLARAPRTLTGPEVEIPEGTTVTLAGQVSKPVREVRWQLASDEEGTLPTEMVTGDFARRFEVGGSNLGIEITLVDEDGIESAEPFVVAIRSRLDSPPQVEVERNGIGLAVTSVARIPLGLRLEDDYALDRVWIEIKPDQGEARQLPVSLPQPGIDLATVEAVVDLRPLAEPGEGSEQPPLKLAPGDRLHVTVLAADRYNLAPQPRHGASRQMTFEVVSPEDLVARLSGSEQSLRQTFEAIADKLLVLYGSLETLDLQPVALQNPNADEVAGTADAEGDSQAESESADEWLAREAGRLAENMRQMADETRGVAAGFADLRAQLDNNRIDNTQLADRLGNKIAVPLEQLGRERMKQVGDQIAAVRDAASLDAARQGTRLCIAEVERLLREMQGLEDYNEVVALLRDIIRQHEQIHLKTKEKEQAEIRNLLLE